ncbi:MAG: hypothetical protein P8H96_08615 [Akkermansiaceae bacterium]|nr:hypothetical protein [Akkermansiaceae bacterium]
MTHKNQLSLGRIGEENVLPIVLRRNSPLPLTMVIAILTKSWTLLGSVSGEFNGGTLNLKKWNISLIALFKQGQCFSDKETRQNQSATQEHH